MRATDDILRRIPPQNLEAEQSVLGAFLLDNDTIDQGAALLRADDFYRESHRELFAVMLELHQRRQPVDAITVTDSLRARGKLETIGGPAYIGELAACVPTASNMTHYARIVREKAVLRQLATVATEAASLAYDGGGSDVKAFLADVDAKLVAVTRQRVWSEEKPLYGAVQDVLASIEQGELAGVPTGFPTLDEALTGGGLGRGTLNVLAAATSVGKSALALNIGLRQNRGGTLYLSVEMNRAELIRRALSEFGYVDWATISKRRPPYPDSNEYAQIAAAALTLTERNVEILYRRGLRPSDVSAEARMVLPQWDGKLDLIVIDYLQLMRADRPRDGRRRRDEEIGEITSALKDTAAEFDCPVLLLSQLNREAGKTEDQEPELRHLRESGAIEQDSDTVIFLWPKIDDKERRTGERMLNWKIAKQRNGPQVRLPSLRFDREFTRFRDG